MQRLRDDVKLHVTAEVAALTSNWKDQKLLDIETTEAIVNRIQAWAKLFGFFVAIPLAVIALLLGTLGWHSYSEFEKSVESEQVAVEQKVQKATETMNNLSDTSTKLFHDQEMIARREDALVPRLKTTEEGLHALSSSQSAIATQQKTLAGSVQRLKTDQENLESMEKNISTEQITLDPKFKQLEEQASSFADRANKISKQMLEADRIVERQNELDSKIQGLQSEIVNFKSSKDLDPTRQQAIIENLDRFRKYMLSLGFPASTSVPTISINANQNQATMVGNEMRIGKSMIDEPEIYLGYYAPPIIQRASNGSIEPIFIELVAEYYVYNFTQHYPGGNRWSYGSQRTIYNWSKIIWDIHSSFYQKDSPHGDFADNLLAMAIKKSSPRLNRSMDEYLNQSILNASDMIEGGVHTAALKDLLARDLPVLPPPPK